MAPPTPLDALAAPLKQAITGEIIRIFNDPSRKETPVRRRPDGLFGAASVAWRVHGDVVSMLVGGMASLLLQMLHPPVLAGVWDHSRFRDDMDGRLRRTARFIALTTYGGREEAEEAIARVRRIHDHVRGTLPDGTPYEANDPALLHWVHVTECWSFLEAYLRYVEPAMPVRAQDRYFAEMAEVGGRLGAAPLPLTRREAAAQLQAARPLLRFDGRTRAIQRVLLHQKPVTPAAGPLQALLRQAALDLVPAWARRMHGLEPPLLALPLVRAGTLGAARTLRWAFS